MTSHTKGRKPQLIKRSLLNKNILSKVDHCLYFIATFWIEKEPQCCFSLLIWWTWNIHFFVPKKTTKIRVNYVIPIYVIKTIFLLNGVVIFRDANAKVLLNFFWREIKNNSKKNSETWCQHFLFGGKGTLFIRTDQFLFDRINLLFFHYYITWFLYDFEIYRLWNFIDTFFYIKKRV
jgi:hypothetical protein